MTTIQVSKVSVLVAFNGVCNVSKKVELAWIYLKTNKQTVFTYLLTLHKVCLN